MASQSSLGWGGVPSRAVDGNNSGLWREGSITHTNQEDSPWWQLDLGAEYDVTTIKLWNRTDCCTQRLANFYVMVSDTPFNGNDLNTNLAESDVMAIHNQGIAGRETEFTFNRGGRYVRVQIVGQGILSLAEVEVMGRAK